MIKLNERLTAADEVLKQRRAKEQLRARQLEEALCLIEDKMNALIEANRKFFDGLCNDGGGVGGFGPRVEVALGAPQS